MLAKCESKVFIHPGQFHFSDSGCHIHTILGSCVSITLWHPVRHVGGMCHFVLPKRTSADGSLRPNGRYGDEAMELFRRQVAARGTKFTEYQAKVFGGSNMLGADEASAENSIGTRNAEAAIMALMDLNVEILVMHVGESGHRRVVFDVGTGDVWVRHESLNGKRMASTSGIS